MLIRLCLCQGRWEAAALVKPALGGLAQASLFVQPQPQFFTCSLPGQPGVRSCSQIKAWPPPHRSSFPPRPWGWAGCGNLGGRREAGCEGADGRVLFSLPASSEGWPSRPLATVAAFTPPLCLLTQGRLPQGGRCRLGNEGVQGPPKQPAAGPLRNPECTSGVGVGGCRSPPQEAHGKGRACVPGKAKEDRGPCTGPSLQGPLTPGIPSQPAQTLPLPGPGAGTCCWLQPEKSYDKALPGRAPSVSLGGSEPDSHQDRVPEQPLGLELP